MVDIPQFEYEWLRETDRLARGLAKPKTEKTLAGTMESCQRFQDVHRHAALINTLLLDRGERFPPPGLPEGGLPEKRPALFWAMHKWHACDVLRKMEYPQGQKPSAAWGTNGYLDSDYREEKEELEEDDMLEEDDDSDCEDDESSSLGLGESDDEQYDHTGTGGSRTLYSSNNNHNNSQATDFTELEERWVARVIFPQQRKDIRLPAAFGDPRIRVLESLTDVPDHLAAGVSRLEGQRVRLLVCDSLEAPFMRRRDLFPTGVIAKMLPAVDAAEVVVDNLCCTTRCTVRSVHLAPIDDADWEAMHTQLLDLRQQALTLVARQRRVMRPESVFRCGMMLMGQPALVSVFDGHTRILVNAIDPQRHTALTTTVPIEQLHSTYEFGERAQTSFKEMEAAEGVPQSLVECFNCERICQAVVRALEVRDGVMRWEARPVLGLTFEHITNSARRATAAGVAEQRLILAASGLRLNHMPVKVRFYDAFPQIRMVVTTDAFDALPFRNLCDRRHNVVPDESSEEHRARCLCGHTHSQLAFTLHVHSRVWSAMDGVQHSLRWMSQRSQQELCWRLWSYTTTEFGVPVINTGRTLVQPMHSTLRSDAKWPVEVENEAEQAGGRPGSQCKNGVLWRKGVRLLLDRCSSHVQSMHRDYNWQQSMKGTPLGEPRMAQRNGGHSYSHAYVLRVDSCGYNARFVAFDPLAPQECLVGLANHSHWAPLGYGPWPWLTRPQKERLVLTLVSHHLRAAPDKGQIVVLPHPYLAVRRAGHPLQDRIDQSYLPGKAVWLAVRDLGHTLAVEAHTVDASERLFSTHHALHEEHTERMHTRGVSTRGAPLPQMEPCCLGSAAGEADEEDGDNGQAEGNSAERTQAGEGEPGHKQDEHAEQESDDRHSAQAADAQASTEAEYRERRASAVVRWAVQPSLWYDQHRVRTLRCQRPQLRRYLAEWLVESTSAATDPSGDLELELGSRPVLLHSQTLRVPRVGIVRVAVADIAGRLRAEARDYTGKLVGSSCMWLSEWKVSVGDRHQYPLPSLQAWERAALVQPLLDELPFSFSRSDKLVEKRRRDAETWELPPLEKLDAVQIASSQTLTTKLRTVKVEKRVISTERTERQDRLLFMVGRAIENMSAEARAIAERMAAREAMTGSMSESASESTHSIDGGPYFMYRMGLADKPPRAVLERTLPRCGCCGDIIEQKHGRVCKHTFKACKVCRLREQVKRQREEEAMRLAEEERRAIEEELRLKEEAARRREEKRQRKIEKERLKRERLLAKEKRRAERKEQKRLERRETMRLQREAEQKAKEEEEQKRMEEEERYTRWLAEEAERVKREEEERLAKEIEDARAAAEHQSDEDSVLMAASSDDEDDDDDRSDNAGSEDGSDGHAPSSDDGGDAADRAPDSSDEDNGSGADSDSSSGSGEKANANNNDGDGQQKVGEEIDS